MQIQNLVQVKLCTEHGRAFSFLRYIPSLTSSPCKQIKSMRNRTLTNKYKALTTTNNKSNLEKPDINKQLTRIKW